MNGLNSVEKFATDWLLSALLCCYKSAECEQSIYGKFGKTALSADSFSPSARLLDFDGGSLSKEDILLAQGHPDFQNLPLLIFCLIQSDALRPSYGDFRPSLDARAAAAANLSNMPPSSLSRAIAPRLDLWIIRDQSADETPVVENVRMSLDDLQYVVIEQMDSPSSNISQKCNVPFILIDSPWIISVCNCQHLVKSDISNLKCKASEVIMNAVQEAQCSYRVAPPVDAKNDTYYALEDFLIEDSITKSLLNFREWKKKVAAIVFQYISE